MTCEFSKKIAFQLYNDFVSVLRFPCMCYRQAFRYDAVIGAAEAVLSPF
jgi:hypothetical protein